MKSVSIKTKNSRRIPPRLNKVTPFNWAGRAGKASKAESNYAERRGRLEAGMHISSKLKAESNEGIAQSWEFKAPQWNTAFGGPLSGIPRGGQSWKL